MKKAVRQKRTIAERQKRPRVIRQKPDLMGGPKKQLNVRMRLTLLSEIEELAAARGLKPSEVALGFLEEAIVNKCPRCHFGLAPGSTRLRPKPCRFCFGTGRVDQAKAHRRIKARR